MKKLLTAMTFVMFLFSYNEAYAVTNVELSWTASPSPDVVAYEVCMDTNCVNVGNALTYVFTDVADGTYTFKVAAIDGAGNKSAYLDLCANQVIDTTPPAPPASGGCSISVQP